GIASDEVSRRLHHAFQDTGANHGREVTGLRLLVASFRQSARMGRGAILDLQSVVFGILAAVCRRRRFPIWREGLKSLESRSARRGPAHQYKLRSGKVVG